MLDSFIWDLLGGQQSGQQGEYIVSDTKIIIDGRPVLAGLDGNGCRHLLLPVARGTVFHEDRKSAGVHVVSHELTDGKSLLQFVDLVCLKPHLNPLFAVLVREILEDIQKNNRQPHVTCLEMLNRWRDLLEIDRGSLLGSEALRGLFGELWYLRMITLKGTSCLPFWTGPEKHRHDFSRGDVALEVKTTSQKKGRSHEIHGLFQMEAPPGGTLCFASIRVESTPDSGESVPELVEELVASGLSHPDLLAKLAKVGYQIADVEVYREIRFTVLEDRFYVVDEVFPRIIRGSFVSGDLPSGVLEISYTIDLSGDKPVPLENHEKDKVLGQLSGVSL